MDHSCGTRLISQLPSVNVLLWYGVSHSQYLVSTGYLTGHVMLWPGFNCHVSTSTRIVHYDGRGGGTRVCDLAICVNKKMFFCLKSKHMK